MSNPPDGAAAAGGPRVDPASPRVLICSTDAEEAEAIQAACEELECRVDLATGPDEPHDLVFVDAAMGERRISDVIAGAKLANPDVAILLVADDTQVAADPTLLMLVGYEYVPRPVHQSTISVEARLRLDQQRARRVSAALASTLEYDGLLEVLLTVAVAEVLSDTASILAPTGNGNELRLEAALGLPGDVTARGHVARDDGIAEWVFEHGESMILQGGFADLPVTSVAADRNIASAMIVPLIVGRHSVGVLCVARLNVESPPFTLRQLRALEIIAMQAAVAIHNAQTHVALLAKQKWDHELDVARVVQQHLLPHEFPIVEGLTVQAANAPAHHIGGDFYDVFRLGDSRLGVVVGDVSGKGIPGALLMIQCMNDVRLAVQAHEAPADVLSMVNERVVTHATRGMFVTLLYAVLDVTAGRIEYANAGHLPALLVRGGTHAAEFVGQAEHAPLGLLPHVRYSSGKVPFGAGDALMLFTDGVIEAKNAGGDEFGFDRLRGLFHERPTLPASLVGFVLKSVQAFADTQPQHDDLTLLGVRHIPPTANHSQQ